MTSFWKYETLTNLSYYLLLLMLVLGLIRFFTKLLSRVKEKTLFFYWNTAKEKKNWVYNLIEENKPIDLEDLIIGSFQIILNLKKEWKYNIRLTLIFYLLFCSFKPIISIFFILYFFSLLQIGVTVFLFNRLGHNGVIKPNIFRVAFNHSLIENISNLFLLPYNWAFLTIYYCIGIFGTKWIPKYDALPLLSILLLERPFWYIKLCLRISFSLESIVFNEIWARKNLKAYPEILKRLIRNSCINFISQSTEPLYEILKNRRILVIDNKVKLNGGEFHSIFHTFGKPVIENPQELIPSLVELKGVWHQAFYNKKSNAAAIFTTKPKIYLNEKEYAKTFDVVKFDAEGKQFIAFTYLDPNQTIIIEGHKLEVMSHLGLYNYHTLIGFLFKLNYFFKYSTSNELLLQDYTTAKLFKLRNKLPLEEIYKGIPKINYEEVKERTEDLNKIQIDLSNNSKIKQAQDAYDMIRSATPEEIANAISKEVGFLSKTGEFIKQVESVIKILENENKMIS